MANPAFTRPRIAATNNLTSDAQALIRAVVVGLAHSNDRFKSQDQHARDLYPSDTRPALVLKAAAVPADAVTPAWAAALASPGAIVDMISLLAPASVGAALLKRCLNFEWPPGVTGLAMPAVNVSANYVQWIGEGLPIPVVDFASSKVTVTPKKLATIAVFSREIFLYSTPAIEQIVRTALGESLALALDARMFSPLAADTITPPGIFAGVAPLTASTATIPSEAMAEDLSAVIGSVSAVAGNNPIVLAMSPRQAANVRVRTDIGGSYEVLASSALPDKTIAAVATNALFSVGSTTPEFQFGFEGAVHMEDTTPLAIGTPGAPPTVAAPTRSLFQTDCVSLRMRFPINWASRAPAGIALIQNVTW
jgi:hypothetical protein